MFTVYIGGEKREIKSRILTSDHHHHRRHRDRNIIVEGKKKKKSKQIWNKRTKWTNKTAEADPSGANNRQQQQHHHQQPLFPNSWLLLEIFRERKRLTTRASLLICARLAYYCGSSCGCWTLLWVGRGLNKSGLGEMSIFLKLLILVLQYFLTVIFCWIFTFVLRLHFSRWFLFQIYSNFNFFFKYALPPLITLYNNRMAFFSNVLLFGSIS